MSKIEGLTESIESLSKDVILVPFPFSDLSYSKKDQHWC